MGTVVVAPGARLPRASGNAGSSVLSEPVPVSMRLAIDVSEILFAGAEPELVSVNVTE
jgi:hypothetical protein